VYGQPGQFRERLETLEQHTEILERRARTVAQQLRWWRALACGVLVLAVLSWALPESPAQEQGLAQRVAALEDLLKHFSREGNEVFITGANLHIVNGLGSTDCTDEEGEEIPDCPNGLGNLIVGYNELRNSPDFPDVRTGSHNVVVGQQHNFSRFGGLVVGEFNTISGDFAAVSGGLSNTASGTAASVSGGNVNRASGGWPSGSGGQVNTAEGVFTSVSGGLFNVASGIRGSVSGGSNNTASGFDSSVSGGQGNEARGDRSSVSGGLNRTAPGEHDWVAGSLFEDE
jgi:hypothetical protein